jgi:hypothetical protein
VFVGNGEGVAVSVGTGADGVAIGWTVVVFEVGSSTTLVCAVASATGGTLSPPHAITATIKTDRIYAGIIVHFLIGPYYTGRTYLVHIP